MSGISNDLSSVGGSSIGGSSPTPAQQVDEALVGTPNSISEYETATESGDATLLDLSTTSSSSSIDSELSAEVPADLAAAGALVNALAGQISGSGSQASSAYSLLSADATLKLTQD